MRDPDPQFLNGTMLHCCQDYLVWWEFMEATKSLLSIGLYFKHLWNCCLSIWQRAFRTRICFIVVQHIGCIQVILLYLWWWVSCIFSVIEGPSCVDKENLKVGSSFWFTHTHTYFWSSRGEVLIEVWLLVVRLFPEPLFVYLRYR